MVSQLLECTAKGFFPYVKSDQLGCYPNVDGLAGGESISASGASARQAVMGSLESRCGGRQAELAKRMRNEALGYRQISLEHPRMPQLSDKGHNMKVECVVSLPSPSSSPTRSSTEAARNWFRGEVAERPARHGPSRADDSLVQIVALQERIQATVQKLAYKEGATKGGRRSDGESVRPGNMMIAERLLEKVMTLHNEALHERQNASRLSIKLVATLKVLQMEVQLLENSLELNGKEDGSFAAKGIAESVLGMTIPDDKPETSSGPPSTSNRKMGGAAGMAAPQASRHQFHVNGRAVNGKLANGGSFNGFTANGSHANGSSNGFHGTNGFHVNGASNGKVASNGFHSNGASNSYHANGAANGTANGSVIPGIPSYQPSVPLSSEIFEKQKAAPSNEAAGKGNTTGQSQTWLSKMLAGSIGPSSGKSMPGPAANGRGVNGVPEGGLITNGMPGSSRGDTSIWGGWDRVKEINEWWDHEAETQQRAEALRSAELERKAAVMHTMDMAMREGEMERLKKELVRMHHDMELLRQAEASRVSAMEGKLKTLERELAKRIPLHAHEDMVRKLKGPLLEARAKVKALSNEVKEKEVLLASMKKEMSLELQQAKGLAEGAAEKTVAFLEKELAQAREQAKSFASELERRERALVQRHDDWARERSMKLEPTGIGAAFAWVAAVVVTGMIAITF